TSPHTAQSASSGRICYQHHPLYNQEVHILRRFRRRGGDSLIVRPANGPALALPAWMLDPVACSTLRQAPQPLIALDALRQLRKLLDTPPWSAGAAAATADDSNLKGVPHAAAQPAGTPAASAPRDPTADPPLETAAHRGPASLSAPAEPTAPTGPASRTTPSHR